MAKTMTDKQRNGSQGQALEARERGDKEKVKASVKSSGPVARGTGANKAGKKADVSWASRMRASGPISFLLSAWNELRYKVTWPTVSEARNMTITVIALSAAVGLVLGAADLGLQQLFQLIIRR